MIYLVEIYFFNQKRVECCGNWESLCTRGIQRESNHQSGQSADIYCHLLNDQQTVLKNTDSNMTSEKLSPQFKWHL